MSFPIEIVIPLLEQEVKGYQVPVVDLIAIQTQDPFKVLIATILSARTRDEVTAAASRRLFAQAGTVEALAEITVEELEKLIYPVGFFRNKAKHLHALPALLQERFQGCVPDSIEDLLLLPGVGRKTANLVRAVAFSKSAICVDTHVHRIMNIWGYVHTETPLQTEMALREALPEEYWIRINGILVAFGQEICRPLAAHCDRCPIEQLCPKLRAKPRKILKEKMEPNMDASPTIKCVSWNVNGIRAALKNGFLEVLRELDADLFALQEIKVTKEQLPPELKEIPGYQAFWYPAKRKGYSGTAILSKVQPLQVLYGLGASVFDDEGRVLTLEFADFYFVTSYSPNAQPELKRLTYKQDFHQSLQGHLDHLSKRKSVILCGDLNVAHKEIDLARPKENAKNPGFSPEERAWMDTMVESGYIDTFRALNTSPGQYTWWSYRSNAREKNIGWRIDYFLVDAASSKRIRDAAIHAAITGSDHCPVSLLFSIEAQ